MSFSLLLVKLTIMTKTMMITRWTTWWLRSGTCFLFLALTATSIVALGHGVEVPADILAGMMSQKSPKSGKMCLTKMYRVLARVPQVGAAYQVVM